MNRLSYSHTPFGLRKTQFGCRWEFAKISIPFVTSPFIHIKQEIIFYLQDFPQFCPVCFIPRLFFLLLPFPFYPDQWIPPTPLLNSFLDLTILFLVSLPRLSPPPLLPYSFHIHFLYSYLRPFPNSHLYLYLHLHLQNHIRRQSHP